MARAPESASPFSTKRLIDLANIAISGGKEAAAGRIRKCAGEGRWPRSPAETAALRSREGGRPLAGKKGTFPADALLAFARLTAALLLVAAVVLLLLAAAFAAAILPAILTATLVLLILAAAEAALLPGLTALLILTAAEAALLAGLTALLFLTAAAALAPAALGHAAGPLLVLIAILIVVSHLHASSLLGVAPVRRRTG